MKLFIIFLFPFILFSSCDFSSQLHKDILEAQEFIHSQDYSKSINKYLSILKKNPPQIIKFKIYFQLGELYSIHLNNYKEALKYFSKLKEESEDPTWMVKAEEEIAEINFTSFKKYEEAMIGYDKLVRFMPVLEKHDFYEYRLGLSCIFSGKIDKAIKIFEKISKNSNHEYYMDSFYQLGVANFSKKSWKQAIKFWLKHIKIEVKKEKVVRTKFLVANTYETIERLEEAYDIYYSLLGDYPNPEVLKNRLKSIYSRRISRKR